MKTMRRALIALVLLTSACESYGSGNGGGSSDSGSESSSRDISAEAACNRFEAFAIDARDGVLTISEMRDRVADIDDHAQLSDDARLRSTSRNLLAALTSGTGEEAGVAVTALGAACQPYLG